jgi:hypothetical protein
VLGSVCCLVQRPIGYVALRSFDAHLIFDAFDLRSLAAGLNRCSAPCGVMPPTASPISRQLAPCPRAASADRWHRRSADRRRWSANRRVASDPLLLIGNAVDNLAPAAVDDLVSDRFRFYRHWPSVLGQPVNFNHVLTTMC